MNFQLLLDKRLSDFSGQTFRALQPVVELLNVSKSLLSARRTQFLIGKLFTLSPPAQASWTGAIRSDVVARGAAVWFHRRVPLERPTTDSHRTADHPTRISWQCWAHLESASVRCSRSSARRSALTLTKLAGVSCANYQKSFNCYALLRVDIRRATFAVETLSSARLFSKSSHGKTRRRRRTRLSLPL